jgi:two-component system response regulator VicR
MLTAKDQRIDKLIGLHVVRVDDYITKPFGRAELLERIRRVLQERHKAIQ